MSKDQSPYQKMMSRSPKNNDLDFFPTPYDAIHNLVIREPFNHRNTWECACGDGAISRVLEKAKHNVFSTDIVNRGYEGQVGTFDFLNVLQPPKQIDNIITNPPFKLAQEFVEHALDILPKHGKVAILARLMFLETKSRFSLFNNGMFKKVYVFSYRLTFPMPDGKKRQKGGMTPYAWFIWEKDYYGSRTIDWIKEKQQ